MDRRKHTVIAFGRGALLQQHWAGLYVLVAAIGLVILVIARPQPHAPEESAACRAQTAGRTPQLACLGGRAPDILSAELAGEARTWACQLQRAEPPRTPSVEQARCAEQRAARLREEIMGFDNGLFIPLYASLSLLVVGWAASPAEANQAPLGRGIAAAAALAIATAALVGLDRLENREAVVMIDRMVAWGVSAAAGGSASLADPALAEAARAARQASLIKWAASAAWAAALAFAFTQTLRDARTRLHKRSRLAGWFAVLPPLALAVASLCFAVGAAAGWLTPAIALPAQLLAAGMAGGLLGMLAATLVVAAAWLARRA